MVCRRLPPIRQQGRRKDGKSIGRKGKTRDAASKPKSHSVINTKSEKLGKREGIILGIGREKIENAPGLDKHTAIAHRP
jgi:hypothetical protein